MEIKPTTTVCITDGACKQGIYCGAGVIIIDQQTGKIISEHSKYTGEGTNNQSEYWALEYGLEIAESYAREKNSGSILILSDSRLIIEQLNGVFTIKQPELKKLHNKIKIEIGRLRAEGFEVKLDCISREYTVRADELASEAARQAKMTDTEQKYPFLLQINKQ